MSLVASILTEGKAKGEVLILSEPLSFWGGTNLDTGEIVDVHHPQRSVIIKNKILFLPGTKGSTAGPGALLELIDAGNGPAAIVLTKQDTICVVASSVAAIISDKQVPILRINSLSDDISNGEVVEINGNKIIRSKSG